MQKYQFEYVSLERVGMMLVEQKIAIAIASIHKQK